MTQQRTPSNASAFLAISAFVIALLALAVAVYSPASRSEAMPESTLAKVKRTGKLKVGYIVYPPFVNRDPNTQNLSGYFVEAMEIIAHEAGFAVEYEETTWGTMVVGLQSKKFDLVVSGVFRTIPRALEVTFVDPILYIGTSGIALADDKRIRTPEDLAIPGLRIAVLNGAVSHEYAKKHLPNAELIVVSGGDIARPFLEVVAERADIALAEALTCARFAKEHPGVRDVFGDQPLLVFGTTFMLRRNDREWQDFLNIAISRLELDGTIARLDEKYRKEIGASSWFIKSTPYEASEIVR